MHLAHLPSTAQFDSWPPFSMDTPLRVLVSGCIAGRPCGVDGGTNGVWPLAARLLSLPNVRAIPYCPEDAAMGTPRATPDIVGGNGFDVLDGNARFVTDTGDDCTASIIESAHEMAALAHSENAHVALLMDISAACGSTVIYRGNRTLKVYQKGPGVAAAALIRSGLPIVSQRDERTLAHIIARLGGSSDGLLTDGLDHHQRDWYREYFSVR